LIPIRRATVFLLVFGIGSSLGRATDEPAVDQNQPAYTRPDAAGRVWGHLQALQNLGPRPAGSDAAINAGRYFSEQMKAQGFDVHEQDFKDLDGQPGANWIADHNVSPSKSFLLVAAHLDTVPKSPGANDDASGIAAVIEIAKEVQDQKTTQPVRFIAFGSEEDFPGYGRHYGASQYLDNLPQEERSRISGEINLDRVGRGDHLFIERRFNRDPSLARRLQTAAYQLLGQPSKVTNVWKLGISPFDQYLIPVAHVEWKSAPDTHRPTDVIDRIQIHRILQTIGVVTAFLSSPVQ
jgi:hypothetical protein